MEDLLMDIQENESVRFTKSLPKAIITAWLIAGTLDITSAIIIFIINNKTSVIGLFQYIASGVFGNSAFSGGIPMAIAGLLFHYTFALIWTLVFFFIYPKIQFISKHKYTSGVLYGIFVWLFMNLIVVKLSRVPVINFSIGHRIVGIIILILFISSPILYISGRYYSDK